MIEDKLTDEEGQLAALSRYEILDTAEEESQDLIDKIKKNINELEEKIVTMEKDVRSDVKKQSTKVKEGIQDVGDKTLETTASALKGVPS